MPVSSLTWTGCSHQNNELVGLVVMHMWTLLDRRLHDQTKGRGKCQTLEGVHLMPHWRSSKCPPKTPLHHLEWREEMSAQLQWNTIISCMYTVEAYIQTVLFGINIPTVRTVRIRNCAKLVCWLTCCLHSFHYEHFS